MAHREETLVPFPPTLRASPQATHCRGTLLLASRETLRRHGHYDRYVLHLPPEHDATLVASIGGTWLPIAVGLAHYRACDALDLSDQEQLDMGAEVVHEMQRTFIGTVLRGASRGAGLTPIFGLEKFFGVYSRIIQGGGGRLIRLGPKDVRVEFVGIPFAPIRYFRVAYRGFIQAGCEFFARRVIVAELGAYHSPTRVAYRIAWV